MIFFLGLLSLSELHYIDERSTWWQRAWNDAGPDPDIVRVGSTWYAYTTGTSWGNNIGVLTSSVARHSAVRAGWL